MADKQQKLNVAFRSLDGRKIQPFRCKMVLCCVFDGSMQDLAMGGGLPHDTFLADLFSSGLKLRLDQANTAGVGRADGIGNRGKYALTK